jgi:hypothetical protein
MSKGASAFLHHALTLLDCLHLQVDVETLVQRALLPLVTPKGVADPAVTLSGKVAGTRPSFDQGRFGKSFSGAVQAVIAGGGSKSFSGGQGVVGAMRSGYGAGGPRPSGGL